VYFLFSSDRHCDAWRNLFVFHGYTGSKHMVWNLCSDLRAAIRRLSLGSKAGELPVEISTPFDLFFFV